MSRRGEREPDLGDLVIVLLAGTLEGVRDGLAAEGFADAADFVGELADAADHYAAKKLSAQRP